MWTAAFSLAFFAALSGTARAERPSPARAAGASEQIDVGAGFARFFLPRGESLDRVDASGSSAAPGAIEVDWKGTPQPITRIVGGAEGPLELVILVDRSASLGTSFASVRDALVDFVEHGLAEGDAVRAETFGDGVRPLAEGREAVARALAALDAAPAGEGERTLFFAAATGALERFDGSEARAALLVVSDACDSLREPGALERLLDLSAARAVPMALISPSRDACRNTTCSRTPSGEWRCAAAKVPAMQYYPSTQGTHRLAGSVEMLFEGAAERATSERDRFFHRLEAAGGLVLRAKSESDWGRELATLSETLARQWTVVFETTSAQVRSDEVRVYLRNGGRRKALRTARASRMRAPRPAARPNDVAPPDRTEASSAADQQAAATAPAAAAALPVPPKAPAGAEPVAARSAASGERIDVEVVDVDVVVTDRSGRRIVDLARDDFAIEVDGKPRPIAYFTPPGPVLAESSPGAATTEPTIEEIPRSSLLVFVDRSGLEAHDLGGLVDAVRAPALAAAAAGVAVEVASFADRLEVHSRSTTDAATVERALAEVRARGARGTFALLERRHLLEEVGNASQGGRRALSASSPQADHVASQIEVYEQAEAARHRRLLAAVEDRLAASAGGAPGARRTLLLATPGFDPDPGRYFRDLLGQSARRADERSRMASARSGTEGLDVAKRVEELVRRTQDARVVAYVVTPAGHPRLPGAEDWSSPLGGRAGPLDRSASDAARNAARLAEATGGRAILFGQGLEERLGALEADRRATYSLGFATGPADGTRPHSIRVRVASAGREGLDVRGRDQFRRRSEAERREDALATAARSGLTEGPLELALAGEAVSAGESASSAKVELRIPLAALALAGPGDDATYRAALEVRFAVAAEDGTVQRGAVDEVAIAIPAADLAAARGTWWPHRSTVEFRGEVGIGALVVERATGEWSTAAMRLGGTEKPTPAP